MEIIRGYEQQLSSTCTEITLITGKLRQASSPQEVDELSVQLEVLFSDARETLEQMELESHGLEQGPRERVQVRLSSYGAELTRQEEQVNLSKTEASQRSDRLELFNLGSRDIDAGESSHLLDETDEILNQAGKQLQDGRRLLAETEEVGANVLGDLADQRETIQRSRSRLKDVEAGLGQSSTILKKMVFRAQQNKIILFLVALAILFVIMFGIYRLRMALWGLKDDEGVFLQSLLCILRVPGIIILDMWWMDFSFDMMPKSLELEDLAGSCLSLVILFTSMCILLLPLQELVQIYLHLISAAAMSVAFVIAKQFAEEESKRSAEDAAKLSWGNSKAVAFFVEFVRRHLCPIASYITLTSLVAWCCGLTNAVFSRLFPSCYILPIIVSMLGFPVDTVQWMTNVTSGFIVLSSTLFVGQLASGVFEYLYHTCLIYNLVREVQGFLPLAILVTKRMMEPAVLLLYWCFLFAAQIWNNSFELDDKKYTIQDSSWFVQGLVAMSEICESPIILISFCIVLMLISCGVIDLTKKFITVSSGQVGAGVPTMQAGVTEGVVAFVLALQTGLTEIDMPIRISALSIILFVVVATLLQSCLDTVQPVLLSLPATNRRFKRHIPALILSIVLLILPLVMVHALLTNIASDMWTLLVISSCLVTAVQAIGTLVTYGLFVWDSSLPVPSTNIDDYVYYVKGSIRVVELLLAVAVVGCGFYEIFKDRDWSLINSLILVVHCYFNIYSRIAQGWASYLARRQTSFIYLCTRRISELNEASQEELAAHGDVCSICYQEMITATVRTDCRHYFHSHCLRRWLVVQDNCPLCTQSILVKKEQEEEVVENEEEMAADGDQCENTSSDREEEEPISAEETSVLRRRVLPNGDQNTRPVSHLFDGD